MKSGMKQTVIGEIPADWEVMTLGDSCDLFMSNVDKKSKDGELEVSLCNYMDVYNNHYITSSINFMRATATQAQIDKFLLRSGDVIITKDSETKEDIAQAATVTENFEDVLCGYHLALIRPHRSKFNGTFLSSLFGLDSIRRQLINKANGTTRFGLNVATIEETVVPLPPLPEQQKIAEILSAVDEKMVVIDEQLAQTQKLKKGLMQRLLTQGISHTRFKDSPLGKIPESWEALSMKQAAWYQEGPGLRKWQFTDTGIKVINITNMVNGVLELSKTTRHITLKEFHSKYKHFECAAGDIVIASSGNSYCKHAIVREQDLPLVMNTSVIRFQPIGKTVYSFLNQFLKSEMFKKQIDFLITGGAQPNFGPEHLSKVFIPTPPPAEQSQIAEILTTLDDKLQVLTDKKAQYQELKRGLMQQLLMGQRRVRVAAEELAAVA
jgi:type I restriction enzyme S subunit